MVCSFFALIKTVIHKFCEMVTIFYQWTSLGNKSGIPEGEDREICIEIVATQKFKMARDIFSSPILKSKGHHQPIPCLNIPHKYGLNLKSVRSLNVFLNNLCKIVDITL